MNSTPATDGTPEQGKTPPVNGQFPSPATGFRDYLIDAAVAFERYSHDATDYDHDFDEAGFREDAQKLVSAGIRATTEPLPEQVNVKRPSAVLYEVAANKPDGGTFLYRVEGEVIEQGDGWLTVWGDALTVALRIPEADLRHIRRVDPDEPDDWSLPEGFDYMTEMSKAYAHALATWGPHCGEECSEGHTYAGRCQQARDDSEDALRLMDLVTKAYSKPIAEQFDRKFPGDDVQVGPPHAYGTNLYSKSGVPIIHPNHPDYGPER